MQESFDTVLLDHDEESGVATVTLNRPDALNAMNAQLREDVVSAVEELESLDADAEGVAVRVVVIEGAGDRAFSAGADITEFGGRGPRVGPMTSIQDRLRGFGAPIVAKIDGYCLGGGLELAFGCDFRLASESSRLGLPESNLGILPGAGGAQYIARIAGPAVAKEVAMLGEHLPAERAGELGLVHRVFDDDSFDEEVSAFVEKLAGQPPLSMRAIKDSVDHGQQVPLREAIAYDRRVFPTLVETEDHAEGARAFAEDDYEPTFEGR
jgi:enoyl-CoA hydratase/carnithine racemase